LDPLNQKQRTRGRQLRRRQTEAEILLWFHLRGRQLAGAKFRRQLSIGRFVVDFCCMEAGSIVEIDGGQHDERRRADAERSEVLEARGYRVLRFWNNEVMGATEAVLEQIANVLEEHRRGRPRYGG
jgi:very-short-patch-repair endonuclease